MKQRPTVVVDLDDTLVHVTPLAPGDLDNSNYFTIKVNRRKFYVQMRPYLQSFLEKLAKTFDIYIYTSSNQKYANKIIDKILPDVKNSCRFYRDSCINMSGYLVKDFEIINKPLNRSFLLMIQQDQHSKLQKIL